VGNVGIAVSRGQSTESLYVYSAFGAASGADLLRSDLGQFVFTRIGQITPSIAGYPVDLQADVYDRLFAVTAGGDLAQIDPVTAAVLGVDHVSGFRPLSSWSMIAFDGALYLFAGSAGTTAVTRWDLSTKTATPVGTVSGNIIGSSAAPCPR
jgi:hypothetical protein